MCPKKGAYVVKLSPTFARLSIVANLNLPSTKIYEKAGKDGCKKSWGWFAPKSTKTCHDIIGGMLCTTDLIISIAFQTLERRLLIYPSMHLYMDFVLQEFAAQKSCCERQIKELHKYFTSSQVGSFGVERVATV